MEEKTEVIYLGPRMVQGTTIKHAFREVDGRSMVWWPKAKVIYFAGLQIGRIYKLTPEGGLPKPGQWEQIGELGPNERLALQVQSRADQELARATRKEIAPDLAKAVETIRLARFALNGSARSSFDAWLFNQLR